MNEELLNKIAAIAGHLRAETFRAAAKFILEYDCKDIVETGCYRGCAGDGNSTLILATMAREVKGSFESIDINPENVNKAREMLAENGFDIEYGPRVLKSDSIFRLGSLNHVRFAYLDSYDHDPANPGPCQRHELAEIGALYANMTPPCAILLDDFIPETGGKTLLGAKFLEDRGWSLIASGYQLLFALY